MMKRVEEHEDLWGKAKLRQKTTRKVDFEGLKFGLINKIRKEKIRSRLEIYFGQNS